MEFYGKLHYSCCDIKNIESFLDFSVEVFKDLWCVDGQAHSPTWCGGRCSEIRWLLPIVAEF